MQKQPDIYLEIALAALRKTAEFMGDRSLEQYLSDEFCQAAIERELEIAGDALGQLRKVRPDIFDRIPEGAMVIAFRNVLAHGYATLNHRIVYTAATQKAPALRLALQQILADFPSP
jgi:uncharacterized protein with HEPN domain